MGLISLEILNAEGEQGIQSAQFQNPPGAGGTGLLVSVKPASKAEEKAWRDIATGSKESTGVVQSGAF